MLHHLKIMRLIPWLLFIGVFSSLSVQAQTDTTLTSISCGMKTGPNGSEIVDPMNGDICKEDVAYQGLYLLYARILDDPFYLPIVKFFVEDETINSEFTRFANNQINVSDIIYYILSAIAMFVWWILILPLLLIKGGFFVWHAVKMGKLEFNESKGELVSFFSYFSFLILLIIPTGSIMLGQGLSVAAHLLSIKGGNYIYSTYLSTTQLSSIDVKPDEKTLGITSQIFANELVKTQLCEHRTQSAIMTINAKAGSSFFSTGLLGSNLFMDDQADIVERYSKCLGYAEYESDFISSNYVRGVSFRKYLSTREACYSESKGVPVPLRVFGDFYSPKDYGEQHSCGTVRFSYLDDVKMYQDNDTLIDDTEKLQKKYQTSKFYPLFKSKVKRAIGTILKNNSNNIAKETSLNNLFKQEGDSLFGLYFKNEGILKSGTKTEQKFKHIATAASLLGGYNNDSHTLLGRGAALLNAGIHNPYRIREATKELEPHTMYEVDYLIDDAREVAKLIVQYNCALNWSENSAIRKFIVEFNKAEPEYLPELFSNKSVGFECVEFLNKHERGNTDFDRYARYIAYSPEVNKDISILDDVVIVKKMSDTEKISLRKSIEVTQANDYYNQALVEQLVLRGYSAAVRRNISNSMDVILNVAMAEDDADHELRSKGFGMFGGALLFTSRNYQSGSSVKSAIDSSIEVGNKTNNVDYIEYTAFKDVVSAKEVIDSSFNTFTTGNLFEIEGDGLTSGRNIGSRTVDEKEENAKTKILSSIEYLLFQPMDHIKNASGMDLNKTLAEGFEDCLNIGYEYCLSNKVHPIIALSNFGNDMVENMINLIIVSVAVDMTNQLLFDGVKKNQTGTLSGSTSTGNGVMDYVKKKLGVILKGLSKFAKILTIIIGAFSMIAGLILNTLMPLIITLFAIGAFFGYFVPMMSFIYGFMILLLWLVGSFVIAAVLPFYVFFKLKDIEKNYQRGFIEFYEGFLGNYLKPLLFCLSATIAWTLIGISLFMINTMFALIYSAIVVDNGISIAGIMIEAMVYILYFLSLFVTFRMLLKLMISMPDALLKKLKLQGMNDEHYVESLAFEQYVNTQVMKQIAQMPLGGGKKIKSFLYDRFNKNKSGVSGNSNDEEMFKSQIAEVEKIKKRMDDAGGEQHFNEVLNAMERSGFNDDSGVNTASDDETSGSDDGEVDNNSGSNNSHTNGVQTD